MDATYLEKIGLTRGETTVYIALLKLGSTTAGPLVTKAKLQRSAVYFCLESLTEKGLVSHIIKNNVKHFEAASPERLLDYLDKKTNSIENQKIKVRSMIPLLYSYTQDKEKRSQAKLFEGWNGIKSAIDDVLKYASKNDDYLIFNVSADPEIKDRFIRFVQKFHQKRIEKKIPAKIIVGQEYKDTIGKEREKEPKTQVRYLKNGLSTPAAVNVYANKVLIVTWTQNPTAVLIENEDTANSFREYFKIMWQTASKK